MWLHPKNSIFHSAGQHPQEPKRNLSRLTRFKPWINVETGLERPWVRLVLARPASLLIYLLSCLWTPTDGALRMPNTRGYAEVKRVLLKEYDKIKALLSCLLSFMQNCLLPWKKALPVLAVVQGSWRVTAQGSSLKGDEMLMRSFKHSEWATEDGHLLISCCIPPQQTSYRHWLAKWDIFFAYAQVKADS